MRRFAPRNDVEGRNLLLLLIVRLRTPREGCPYGTECIKKTKKNEHPKVFVLVRRKGLEPLTY